MSTQIQTAAHVHQRAREALRRAGHKTRMQKTAEIVRAIERETGKACEGDKTEFILRYLASVPVVKPRTPAPFKPLQLSPALRTNFARASEAQPKLWTPGGRRGNGSEDSKVWRR